MILSAAFLVVLSTFLSGCLTTVVVGRDRQIERPDRHDNPPPDRHDPRDHRNDPHRN